MKVCLKQPAIYSESINNEKADYTTKVTDIKHSTSVTDIDKRKIQGHFTAKRCLDE